MLPVEFIKNVNIVVAVLGVITSTLLRNSVNTSCKIRV